MDNWITGPLVLVRWGSARAGRVKPPRCGGCSAEPARAGITEGMAPERTAARISWVRRQNALFFMIFDGKIWEKSLENIWNMWELCFFFGFWWEKRWNMMGKDLEHVVKRFRVSMVLIGKMWKHVEASGDQTRQWEISEVNGGVSSGQSSIGGFSSQKWSDYQRRNPKSIQFQWLNPHEIIT